jgi:hypothetical protein
MSFINCDLTDQYLSKVYDDFVKEQGNLQNQLRSLGYEDMDKERDIQKQLNIVSQIIAKVVSLKHLKMKINKKL